VQIRVGDVTVTPTGGFGGSVSLALTGLPSGATGSFMPNPTSSGSTLTVKTSNTTKLGAYTLTITGAAAGLNHSTSVTLQIRRK
jgi:hypothetical protein